MQAIAAMVPDQPSGDGFCEVKGPQDRLGLLAADPRIGATACQDGEGYRRASSNLSRHVDDGSAVSILSNPRTKIYTPEDAMRICSV